MQIHELNNYGGTLNSGVFIAVDNGNDTGKISYAQLLNETNEKIDQVDSDLNGRIDNIIAGGDAPSAAEIIDARHGGDDFDYASLGAAIRGQFSLLEESKATNMLDVEFSNSNTRITTGGEYAEQNNMFTTEMIPCNPGDKIDFRGESFIYQGASAMSLIAFYDKNFNYISGVLKLADESVSTVGKVSAIAPAGTAFVAGSTNSSGGDISGFYFHVHNFKYALKADLDTIIEAVTEFYNISLDDYKTVGKYFSFDALTEATASGSSYINYPLRKDETVKISVPSNPSYVPAFFVYPNGTTVAKITIVAKGDPAADELEFTAQTDGRLYINYVNTQQQNVELKKYGPAAIREELDSKLDKLLISLDVYKSEIESGSLQTITMAVSPYDIAVAYLNKIPVQPNEQIEITGQNIAGITYQYRFGFYDSDGTWIDQIPYTSENKLITPANCYYISVGLYAADPDTGTLLSGYNLYSNMVSGVAFKLTYLDRYKEDYTSTDDVIQLINNTVVPQNTGIIELNADAYDKLLQAKRPINNSSNAYLTETQPLVLFHFSDIHADEVELLRATEFINHYSDMIDDSICTGDLVLERWDNGFSYWGGVSGAENILLCIGNHDVLTDPTGWDWTQRASQFDQYNRYFAPYIANWDCIYSAGDTYYYKDYAEKKIRLIVLNCMLEGADNTGQLSWFTAALSGAASNDYSVIVADHYMPANAEKINCNFTSIDKGVSSDILPSQYMDAVQSFINGGGKFICYIAGHTHNDLVVRSQSYPNQICVVIDALNRAQGNQYSDTQRTNETKSQDLFNLFVTDTASGVIKIMRVGADMDHYLRKKECITINYTNGNIITQN